jgi:hypothetical protein
MKILLPSTKLKPDYEGSMFLRNFGTCLPYHSGLEIESRWGRDCSQPSSRPWGPPSLLYNGYRVSFPRVKRPGRGFDHPPSSSAEVKERVELYL